MTHDRKADLARRTKIIKALAHPSRLCMVEELSKKEKCVYDLTDIVCADISTVSKHLAILKKAGIVECEKKGLQVSYRLKMKCVGKFLECVNGMDALNRKAKKT